ncbi:FecR family protein [Deminuibacter soli]|nr:FecR domain-containing protein [Deminuibacter soli]
MQKTPDVTGLLNKYMRGECSIEEIVLLKKWFELVQQQQEEGPLLTAADEERLVKTLHAQPTFARNAAVIINGTHRSKLRWYAAAALLGVTLAGAWLMLKPTQQQGITAKAATFTGPDFMVVATGYKQQKKLMLPDGSVVWLNACSQLKYNKDFIQNRAVQLSGEAFFEVTKDAQHPFSVMAGTKFTQVYGTAFNVAAYAAASEVRIALQNGKIGVGENDGKVSKVLMPGELLIYNNNTGKQQIEQLAAEDINGWTKGKLVFYKSTMTDVLLQLQARYGVHIEYDRDEMANKKVTARFSNITLPALLRHLSFGWDIRFNKTSDTLYIK